MTSTTELFDETKKRFSDFAQKDYELKVTYLTNHFQRMWTRFNYFVVIEAALIGGKTIFGGKAISTAGMWFGLALSLMWYVMGAEDRYLVQVYRHQVKQAGKVLADALWRVQHHAYRYVGDVTDVGDDMDKFPAGWRVEAISTTRLAALIPLAVAFVWLGLLMAKFVGVSF